jgi:phosphinothricin acetyltransferase
MIIRPAESGDVTAIADIYAHHVIHGLGTFEEVPPDAAEMAARKAAVDSLGLPYLVADDGGVVGYAYAGPFRTRAAYRYTVEDSVYVAPGRVGGGIGRALVTRLIGICEDLGLRQMMAVIGDSANAASIGLHRSLGFEITGLSPAVGFKFNRWVDVVWMQRRLSGGEGRAPDGLGLSFGPNLAAGARQ